MSPDMSVIICTRNRAATLHRALVQLTQCNETASKTWELLVVDNGSTDATANVVEQFGRKLPLRYAMEEEPGLSAARNRGIKEARGRWLMWLDDDAGVPAEYLANYQRAIGRYPEATCFGGGIKPILLGHPPRWLSHGMRHVQDAYAARSAPETDQPIKRHTLPYGANFAVRRDIAQQHHFDTRLGRHPERPADGGEELDMLKYALSCGPGWWINGTTVEHWIEAERQSVQYLHTYFFAAGSMSAKARAAISFPERAQSAVRWLAHSAEFLIHRPLGKSPRLARNLKELAWHGGYLKQSFKER